MKKIIITVIVLGLAVWGYVYWNKLLNPPNSSEPCGLDGSHCGSPKNIRGDNEEAVQSTYTYTNHGFSIELPKGFVPDEQQSEGGPSISISVPNGTLGYITDLAFWKKWNMSGYVYVRDQKVGETTFKIYRTPSNMLEYWFEQGNVAYTFTGDPEQFKTFKFVGWAQ